MCGLDVGEAIFLKLS